MGKFRIPIFDVFVDDDSLGLTAVSLVDMPAISEDFIAMSKAGSIRKSMRLLGHYLFPIN